MDDESLLSLSVERLLTAVAARTPAPGGGSTAALATALAAGLTVMAARYGGPADGAADNSAGVAGRAMDLQRRAAALADADANAYSRYLQATGIPRTSDPEARRRAVGAALSEATDVPLAIAEVATEVAGVAAGLVTAGNANVRGDAAAAVLLASAAATAAAILVAENLASDAEDPRRARAAALAGRSRADAEAVTALLPAVRATCAAAMRAADG